MQDSIAQIEQVIPKSPTNHPNHLSIETTMVTTGDQWRNPQRAWCTKPCPAGPRELIKNENPPKIVNKLPLEHFGTIWNPGLVKKTWNIPLAHAITHIVHLLFPSSTHFAALESRESDLCSTGTWSCKRTSRDSPKEIRCYQVSEGITKWYEWWNLLEQRISCGESEHQIAGELSAPWKSRWRGRCRCGHCAPKWRLSTEPRSGRGWKVNVAATLS